MSTMDDQVETICERLFAEAQKPSEPSASTFREHCSLSDVQQRVRILTQREADVFVLLHAVEGNQAIARSLHITERTVRAHLASIHEKFRTSSRVQLTVLSLFLHHRTTSAATSKDCRSRQWTAPFGGDSVVPPGAAMRTTA